MSDSPAAIPVAVSMLRARRVRKPQPAGSTVVDHAELGAVLEELRTGGVPALSGQRQRLGTYRRYLESFDPDELSYREALAYWLNLYNAGALDLAAATHEAGRTSVLRTPGAFREQWATVAGETISLDDIEHGKVRRFGDPRIHAALVCGSASCPTLRLEPYRGADLDEQLDRQMGDFLAGGGAVQDGSRLLLSRIFLWYGSDFVRPHRMPALLPVGRKAVRRTLSPWLGPAGEDEEIGFQPYDWALACSIR
ncbi:MAG: DUF547 domain-containing protein [Acidimicrobiia bacterium]|nr:DUF547 domain-containing protein [Acidimicrobiia bacterium]